MKGLAKWEFSKHKNFDLHSSPIFDNIVRALHQAQVDTESWNKKHLRNCTSG